MIELSPGELLFIAQMMKADKIDYQYITAAEANGEVEDMKNRCRNSLEKKGYIEEDFSGEMELSTEIESVTKPVFFGDTIETLIVTDAWEPENTIAYTFHFQDGKTIKVTPTLIGYTLEETDKKEVFKILDKLVPTLSNEKSGDEVAINSEEDVKRIISRKYYKNEDNSIVDVYFETKTGQYCKENENGKFISVTSSEIKKVY